MRTVQNRIIARVLEPETKTEGGTHLPAGMERFRLTRGECMQAKVVAIVPEVYDVRIGMTVYLDPSQVQECLWEEGCVQYVSPTETYFNWKTEEGHLFGIFHEDEEKKHGR